MKWSVTGCPTMIFLCLAGCFSAAGCSSKISDKSLVMLTCSEGREAVAGKSRLLGLGTAKTGAWVDARTEADFKAGHIPGAVSLPYERLHADHTMLKEYDVIVVYGSDYNDARADGMSKRLMELDYKNVRTLNGGIRAWLADGNELEK